MTQTVRCDWHPECDCLARCEDRPTPPLWAKIVAWLGIGSIALIVLAGIGWLFMATTAAAQESPRPSIAMEWCGPIKALRDTLKTKHNEVEIGGGIVDEQTVIVVFASPDGDTWTMAVMRADGGSCVIDSGENWFQSRIPSKNERPA